MAATLEPFFRVNFGRHRQVTLYREWTKREQVLQEEQQLGIWREFKGRVDSLRGFRCDTCLVDKLSLLLEF